MTTREHFTSDRLFSPGPTPVPEYVRAAMGGDSIYHRSDEFYKAFQEAAAALRPVFGSTEDPLILTSSGSGAMEAAVSRLTNGGRVVCVNGGKFGERWSKINKVYGNEVAEVRIPWGSAPSADEIVKVLAEKETEALFLQANETSTGTYYDIEKIASKVRESFDGFIVVDCISSLGAHPMQMADWRIDCVVAGSQKGFGLPPGLSFIALSDKAWAYRNSRPRFYFDLDAERKGQAKGRSAYTPATTLILGLRAAMQEIHRIGIDAWYTHHHRLATATRAAVDAIGFERLGKDSPSNSVTAIQLPEHIDGNAIVKNARAKYGAFFAGGQDQLKGKVVRIAHLGFVSIFDALDAMACFEWCIADQDPNFVPGEATKTLMQRLRP